MKDVIIILGSAILVVFCITAAYTIISSPQYTISDKALAYNNDPIQKQISDASLINIELSDQSYSLKPLAEYNITAYLVSKRRYRRGFMSKLSPWDYALAWGEVPNHLEHIKFDQIVRFCLYQYKAGAPIDETYIAQHMANTHLIPATDNIRKALAKANKGDIVNLKGILVNVRASSSKGQSSSWNSSTSRDDLGNGACEILYVQSLQIADRMYK
ncbi:MAG TPA: hypothetical protein PL020_04660 [Candidatus Cloacimonadota bacterium]|nr:hypothetical protein [Candidatus Cloacimonadota bacterium]